ncbi:MAG: methyltransferase domain-containing protein [Oscillospiraceae bacterium]|nr:methyltransferase domain-containing protein [Oscillospiraceae bacterium]
MDKQLSFDEDAKNYEHSRPAYPAELFRDVLAYSALSTHSKALEIGIGTGQATLPILKTGCFVTAVELGKNLSAYTAAKFHTFQNFQIQTADFMEIPAAENSLDLVYAATAFHWLPEAAFDKVLYILKPRGAVALFWNHPFPNRREDKTNRINLQVYQKYRPADAAPKEFGEADCEKYKVKLKDHGFIDIQCKLYHRVRVLSSDAYISLLNTYSDHRALSPARRAAFEQEMRAGLNAAGGNIHLYDTIDLYLARKAN